MRAEQTRAGGQWCAAERGAYEQPVYRTERDRLIERLSPDSLVVLADWADLSVREFIEEYG